MRLKGPNPIFSLGRQLESLSDTLAAWQALEVLAMSQAKGSATKNGTNKTRILLGLRTRQQTIFPSAQ